MKNFYIIILILFMASCSQKINEIGGFGGGLKSNSSLPQKRESTQSKTENLNKTEFFVNEPMQFEENTLEIKTTLKSFKNQVPVNHSKIPKATSPKTIKKNDTKINQNKAKNLDLWIHRNFPLYTNVSIILGYIFGLVALGILLQYGLTNAIHILRYGGHGLIVEILLWAFLGFLQILFGNWMKRLVIKRSFGKGFVVFFQFILTFFIGLIAILLGMY
jgi:hypothetical protein